MKRRRLEMKRRRLETKRRGLEKTRRKSVKKHKRKYGKNWVNIIFWELLRRQSACTMVRSSHSSIYFVHILILFPHTTANADTIHHPKID